jgi:glycosyltransferase involved in cell wall biosynthesis
VATHLDDLSRALTGRGIAVTRVDPRRDGPDGRDGRPALAARLTLAAARGDLVHVHTNGHNPKSWLLALAASVAPRGVLTLHSGLAPPFIARHRRLARAAAAGYARVVAVSPEIAEALARARVPMEKIAVLPAFTAASLDFRLPPSGLRGLRRRHRPLVACALAPGPEYGAAVMIDAFATLRARLPAAGLALYGPGTRDPGLASALRARGLAGAVHLFGELDRPRALALMAAADVFVRPTLADGDALSVREALALGRPVIASAVGRRPPEARLFPAGSAADLAELIFHAAGNPAPTAPAAPADALPALLEIYRCCGLHLTVATLGTALAT